MATYNRPLPFEAIHPGSILKDELDFRGIKQKDFATAIGMQPSNFNEIIKGKRPISEKVSIAIGQALGVSGSTWRFGKHLAEITASV